MILYIIIALIVNGLYLLDLKYRDELTRVELRTVAKINFLTALAFLIGRVVANNF